MKLPTALLPRLLRPLLFLALGAIAALPALAQVAGGLSGRISDARTGFSLQGAVVRVAGTTAVAYTDANGRYSLTGLPAGLRKIEVEYVGLDLLTREVEVLAGTTKFFDAQLESKALKMEAFTVAESVRGQALAINQQKTASGLVNIVSEETFNTNLGGNIGFTLQQLPGLSVNEGEDGEPSGVNIRGLEAKYNSVQVDGNRLPSSGNSRAFSVGQINADAIANIEVIKAATPDRDGDALGGIINVISRSAFQRDGRSVELNVGGLYYDKREKWNGNVSVNYLDLFSVAGGQKNLGVGVNLAWSETSRDYDHLDKDYNILRPQFDPALAPSGPLYFHTNAAPQTNYRTTSALSANLALDYRFGPHTTFYLRPFYRHQETDAEKPRALLRQLQPQLQLRHRHQEHRRSDLQHRAQSAHDSHGAALPERPQLLRKRRVRRLLRRPAPVQRHHHQPGPLPLEQRLQPRPLPRLRHPQPRSPVRLRPKGGLYSAGVFYNKMKGFYYSRTLSFTDTDANGYPIPDPTGARLYTSTDNALGATNYGVELIARQKLLFLPAPFNGLGVALSATLTESDGKYPGRLDEDLPTYGFSDRIYNAALEYAGGGFRARLSYTYRSDFLEGLDGNGSLYDDWFGAYESLNWESSYQLNRQPRLFFNVNNLTDEPQISYQGYRRPDNPEDYTKYSWRATVGASYRF